MHRSLASAGHRPWPVPDRAWAMAMTWHDLLFAHWPVDVERIRPLVPERLSIDTRDGAAWIGVVPFRMTGVRARGAPAIPGPGAFAELNVRTYVREGDRPGVWFMSLDAASGVAVAVARRWFHLPYFRAEMDVASRGEDVLYRSRRTHEGARPAEFVAEYGPTGPVLEFAADSLERWLADRWCLYAAKSDGTLLRGEIHHAPWPLQPARASIEVNSMAQAAGLPLPGKAPHLLFARRLDVVAWTAERV